jgi:putative aldouronate transport system permease protein
MMSMAGHRIRIGVGERALNILNYLLVTIFTLICMYPLYYVIIYSISIPSRAEKGIGFLPAGIDFSTYAKIFSRNDLVSAFGVSIARTVLGTILCIICSSMLAYLVTKNEMLFRKFIYRFTIITMYISAGLIPWYLTMKSYGLKNSFLLYILPGAVNAFYLILVKTYIEQLPPSMEESASLDGAGFFTLFFKIILPLSKPIIATIAIYCAVGQWNAWTDNYFLVSDKHLQTLQLILYNYLNNAQAVAESMRNGADVTEAALAITPTSVQMVIISITVVPIMMVYPFLQKYFTKGIMLGAVKG